MLGGDNGLCKFNAQLADSLVFIGEPAQIRVVINNSEAKLPVECLKIQLNREMKIKGLNSAG